MLKKKKEEEEEEEEEEEGEGDLKFAPIDRGALRVAPVKIRSLFLLFSVETQIGRKRLLAAGIRMRVRRGVQ